MPEQNAKTWKHLLWIPINAVLVFSLPYLLVSLMGLSRDSYFIWLYIFSIAFIGLYAKLSDFHWAVSLKSGWALGTISGVFIGLIFLSLATISKPALEISFFSASMLPLLWRGLLYGLVSAALVSVFPFVVVWRALSGINPGAFRKFGVTIVAILSIGLMSSLYNLGLSDLKQENLGNQIGKSLIAAVPTIISGSPLAAPISNVLLQMSESVERGSLDGIQTAKSKTAPGGIN
jgi:hypothetical protein